MKPLVLLPSTLLFFAPFLNKLNFAHSAASKPWVQKKILCAKHVYRLFIAAVENYDAGSVTKGYVKLC